MAKRVVPAALLVLLLTSWSPAFARAEVRIGGGADYWVNMNSGIFEFLLSVDTQLVKHFRVGGRFGALIATNNPTVGIPLDLNLRLTVARDLIYIDGLVGPWILFTDRPIRAHAGFGFGLHSRVVELGGELSWFDPNPTIGLRLAFRL